MPKQKREPPKTGPRPNRPQRCRGIKFARSLHEPLIRLCRGRATRGPWCVDCVKDRARIQSLIDVLSAVPDWPQRLATGKRYRKAHHPPRSRFDDTEQAAQIRKEEEERKRKHLPVLPILPELPALEKDARTSMDIVSGHKPPDRKRSDRAITSKSKSKSTSASKSVGAGGTRPPANPIPLALAPAPAPTGPSTSDANAVEVYSSALDRAREHLSRQSARVEVGATRQAAQADRSDFPRRPRS